LALVFWAFSPSFLPEVSDYSQIEILRQMRENADDPYGDHLFDVDEE